MSTAVSDPTLDTPDIHWRATAPHVRKALAFVKRKGAVTAEELVAWDRDHGRKLFDWSDPHAAEEWRKQQARVFLNRFRQFFEGMRVRAFIHISEDADADIHESAYVTIESITQHEGMRAQVIADIVHRMKSLAADLRLWKLSQAERAAVLARLDAAMAGD